MTQRIPVSMTDEMHEKLSEYAEQRGQALSYVIREAVALYLERGKIRVADVHPGWGGKRKTDDDKND